MASALARTGGQERGNDGDGTRPSRPASPTAYLRRELAGLPPAERRVATHILREPAASARITISDLARVADSSPATIVRLARRFGFDGFRDFRIALATEVGRAEAHDAPLTGIDIRPTDDLADAVAKVAAADIAAIRNTVDALDLASFSAAVQAISGARRTLVVGVGAARLAARDLRDKLYRLRKDVVAATDRHAALVGAAMLTAQDAFVGISRSGEAADVLEPMELAREAGATTIGLTNAPESRLARRAGIVIVTASPESSVRAGGMASRAALMTLVDCLFVAVVQTNYDAALDALERTERALSRTRPDRRPDTSASEP